MDSTLAEQPGRPADDQTPLPAAPPPPLAGPTYAQPAHAQWVVLATVVAAFVLFWWAGNVLSVPARRGFEASLFRQPTVAKSLAAVVAAAGLYLAVFAIASAATWRHWVLAAPMAASAGLAAWSFRGGPSRYVYLAPTNAAAGSGPFWTLAAETLALGAIVAVGWLWLLRRFERDPAGSAGGLASGSPSSGPGFRLASTFPRPDGLVLRAVLAQAALVGVGVVLMVPNDEKKQAVLGVLAASLLGTGIVQHAFQTERLARWFWAGPLLVGLAGYVVNAMGAGAQAAAETGRLAGTFAALARPLPLDYAGAGVVGAIMGYWIGSDHPVPATAGAVPTRPDEAIARPG